MWRTRFLRPLTAVTALVLALGIGQSALAEPPYHMRGTLAEVSGATLTIDTGAGASETVMLTEQAPVFSVAAAAIDDIKAGQFVGITSITVGGEMTAIEVHIFAPELYGLAEGHYPWDLVDEPNMMTNAAVAWIEDVGDGRKLRAKYTEGEERTDGAQTIVVPADATIVWFDAAGRDKLTAGTNVFLLAIDGEDGAITSPAIVVGQDGLEPPM